MVASGFLSALSIYVLGVRWVVVVEKSRFSDTSWASVSEAVVLRGVVEY